jgi:uncharacterized membrane protein YgdD (TMEM256/DUF423 family)
MSGWRTWICLGASLAGLAVLCGAFAAHGLEDLFARWYQDRFFEKPAVSEQASPVKIPLDQKYLADFETGAKYQMYHGLAIILLGLVSRRVESGLLTAAGCLLLLGTIFFCGGLYVYTLADARWAGMYVVPAGGTLFVSGWVAFAIAVVQRGEGDVI